VPMIDLIAIAAVDRETEMTYVRRERDWLERAVASGRDVGARQLPVLPASLAGSAGGNGNGRASESGNGHNGHGPAGGGAAGHAHDR